jgi:hypothetical protein
LLGLIDLEGGVGVDFRNKEKFFLVVRESGDLVTGDKVNGGGATALVGEEKALFWARAWGRIGWRRVAAGGAMRIFEPRMGTNAEGTVGGKMALG